jgi:hypothetical protein
VDDGRGAGDAWPRRDGLGDGVRDRLEQVEPFALNRLSRRSDQLSVVGRSADPIVSDVDLDVQVDDEVLRLIFLAGIGAVMPGRPDPCEEQT